MEVGNQAGQLLRKIVRGILIVTGSLVGLFIILVIIALATGSGDTDSTASDIEPVASEAPSPKAEAPEADGQIASAAGQPTGQATSLGPKASDDAAAADRDSGGPRSAPAAETLPTPAAPEVEAPEVHADPEGSPELGLSEVSLATLSLFRELYGFRNDPEFHRVGFAVAYQFNDWQVRLDDLAHRGRSEIGTVMSEIGAVPGDLRTLAGDYMGNGGCATGNFTRDIDARLIAASEIQATPCVGVEKTEPSPRAATVTSGTASPTRTHAVTTTSGLLDQQDESCQRILARGQSLLAAAQLFCGAFEPGLFEGVGADGGLLNLWVTEALARDLLADRLEARQSVTDMVTLWSNLSNVDFPTIRIYWGDTIVLTGRAKAHGVDVKFEQ